MPKDIPIHRQEVHDEIYKTQPKPTLGLPRKTPSEDPWHPRSDEPASASSNERRGQFLGGLAWSIREKSAKVVSLGEIAQTLIDAVQESGIDLSPADSLDKLKQLLVQSIKRPSA